MKFKNIIAGISACTICAIPTTKVIAQEINISGNNNRAVLHADSHAPIGVMGDHMHSKGDFMFSYRFMRMNMKGNRDGTNNLSPEQIVTSIPNRFSSVAGQPPTLRVVPEKMNTNMHMIGAMYAPTDWLTLMAMGNYIDREMEHITFQGGMGTTRLGKFTTKSSGLGDTKISGLIKLYEDDTNHIHFNAGISLPTGSIKEKDDVLTPMGMRPTLRLPYAMQLGSGTYDLLPGITYTGHKNKFGWGAQYNATLRLGDNSENYSLGNKHQINAWGSYRWIPELSSSLRITAENEGKIDGIDSNIVAPVQTADPDNYGGKRINASLGINYVVPSGIMRGNRFSAEAIIPLYQNLNGPQMKLDNAFIFGWSKSF